MTIDEAGISQFQAVSLKASIDFYDDGIFYLVLYIVNEYRDVYR